MIVLSRCFSVLVLTLAAIPATGWLLLVCADMRSLTDCLAPQPGWTAFALICAGIYIKRVFCKAADARENS